MQNDANIINYYVWLTEGVTKCIEKNYSELFKYLWDMEFYSLVPNDDNRAEDGKQLRYVWCTEVANIHPDDLDIGECTCLEVLIGVANRMYSELFGSSYNMTTKDCFWEIMNNLRLYYFHNGNYGVQANYNEVQKIVDDWLNRKYLKNGIGGLFPLKKFFKDQRKVEIWYQMMSYLDENYTL